MRWNHTRRRLLLVIVATAITVAWYWPSYRDALRRINESLKTDIIRDYDAEDDDNIEGADYRFRHCTGDIGSKNRQCGPWHYDNTPLWEGR